MSSKEEKKKRENEQIKILNSIINKKSHFDLLEPLKKAKEYNLLIKELENNVKYIPEEDKNKKYYKEYLEEIEKLQDNVAEIFFNEKLYNEAIALDKKIIKQNDKYHRSLARLYKSLWAIGNKEDAVIYGSFIIYRCDKKTQDKYYKNLIPEIKTNFIQVAKEFKNKRWWSDIKITRPMMVRFAIFIFCIVYLVKNYNDLKLIF